MTMRPFLVFVVATSTGCGVKLSPLRDPRAVESQPNNCEWVIRHEKGENQELFLCCTDPTPFAPGHLQGTYNPVCWEVNWVKGMGGKVIKTGESPAF